jgi:hypothetical protein
MRELRGLTAVNYAYEELDMMELNAVEMCRSLGETWCLSLRIKKAATSLKR